jgi:hypothetical protein
MSNTRLNGEDHYDAAQRMEGTSRMETKMESQMEGLHAEDNPELVATIKAAQEGQERQAEEVQKEWLAAQADGTVARMEGEVDVRKIIPNEVDNEIDALRKLRLAQMKGRAAERQAWLDRGHGKYAIVEQESSFLEELTRHERVVCALTATGSIDGEMLHAHIKQLCRVHVETYFCRLDPERAPVMMGMVSVGQLPALLLCREGKVVDQLHSIDRSFTTEGIAYEIGQRKCIDFEEGTHCKQTHCNCSNFNRACTVPPHASSPSPRWSSLL